MDKIKKGDIVGRISYGKDILFRVQKVINKANGEKVVILKGMTIRIEADAPIEDLVRIEQERIDNNLRSLETKLEERVKECTKKLQQPIKKRFLRRSQGSEETGLILHLDGDKKYSDKSEKYYKKVGLRAIVRNVPESRQQYVVTDLLNRYHPDILVITGHDRYDSKRNWIQ